MSTVPAVITVINVTVSVISIIMSTAIMMVLIMLLKETRG